VVGDIRTYRKIIRNGIAGIIGKTTIMTIILRKTSLMKE
jgi:hypothetical protein